MMDIPIIDIEELRLHKETSSVDIECIERIGQQVKKAFSTVGFCYIKNHGIDQNLIDSFASSSRVFFEQPVSLKEKFARGTEDFGWIAVERERLNPERPSDLKEAFNYCPANESDDQCWPDVEGFQNLNKEMFAKCTALSFRLCDALSTSLKLDKTFLRDAHSKAGKIGNATTLRSLYYPAILKDSDIKPRQIRLGEHSDFGSMTFVFQDDMGGLEVYTADKGYVPATPIPGTIVVNIGDLMQRWTADTLVSTKHRVLIPEIEINRRKHRQSTVFYLDPDDDLIVKCLDGSNKYEPISALDYLKIKLSAALDASE